MSATGLESFDRTLHETNIWLNEVMEGLGPDRQRAYHALRATLHSIRDRLPVDEAAHLGAQLPMLLRGIYYEGWRPSQVPLKIRSRDAFLARIGEELNASSPPTNPEDAARAVMKTIGQHVTAGEWEEVLGALPKEIQTLAH